MRFVNSERTAASSATRHKIASHLRRIGIKVESSENGRPPTDGDFISAIWDHLIAEPYVASFRRGNDELRIRVPLSVLVWLRVNPEKEYRVLEVEIVSGGFRGKSSV
jgi:hypothetical protein